MATDITIIGIAGGTGSGKSTVVPDHKQELGKGLEHKILKQAGLK